MLERDEHRKKFEHWIHCPGWIQDFLVRTNQLISPCELNKYLYSLAASTSPPITSTKILTSTLSAINTQCTSYFDSEQPYYTSYVIHELKCALNKLLYNSDYLPFTNPLTSLQSIQCQTVMFRKLIKSFYEAYCIVLLRFFTHYQRKSDKVHGHESKTSDVLVSLRCGSRCIISNL